MSKWRTESRGHMRSTGPSSVPAVTFSGRLTPLSVRRLLAVAIVLGISAWAIIASTGSRTSTLAVGMSGPESSLTPTTVASAPTTSTTTIVGSTTTFPTSAVAPATELQDPPQVAPTEVDSAAIEAAAERFCSLSTTYVDQLRLIEISLTVPARLRELFEAVVPAAEESATIASKDLKPDTATVSRALGELRTALEAADYELAKLPPDMITNLQSPPVQEALNRIEAFTDKAC